jgi:hypothetical protein
MTSRLKLNSSVVFFDVPISLYASSESVSPAITVYLPTGGVLLGFVFKATDDCIEGSVCTANKAARVGNAIV